MHKQVSGWTVNLVQIFQNTPFWNWRPEYPPPPHFGKLQIWDDQSLLRNTPLISENFRFGMTKVYSGIPPSFRKTSDLGWPKFTPEYPPHFGKLQIWDDQSLLWKPPPNENCQRVQVRDFQNTESYYMWRLYPTRITTSCIVDTGDQCKWPLQRLLQWVSSRKQQTL